MTERSFGEKFEVAGGRTSQAFLEMDTDPPPQNIAGRLKQPLLMRRQSTKTAVDCALECVELRPKNAYGVHAVESSLNPFDSMVQDSLVH